MLSQIAALIVGASLIVYSSLSFKKASYDDRFDFIAPPKELKHFTFGYNENISDGLWLRVIQNFTVCEKVKGGEAHSKERLELREKGLLGNEPACRKSWVYQMLDMVTTLTPKFRMAYSLGATTLSVLVDDREGAALLFERGMREFPEDWDIAYRAAYHYLYEMNEPEKASKALVKAGDLGAPPWVYALAGKLLTESGKAELAKPVLEDALAKDPDGPGAPRIRQRLDEINAILSRNGHQGP